MTHALIAKVEELFTTADPSTMFAANFLKRVPADVVNGIIKEMRVHGNLEKVDVIDDKLKLRFERSFVLSTVILDEEGKIAGLWLGSPEPRGTIQQLVEEIKKLPGETALLIVSNGQVVTNHNVELVLSVGSAAKIVVLRALSQIVGQGKAQWHDVLRTSRRSRSVPTGILQDWPSDEPITISTLANLMISLSDNTANDILIDFVGKSLLEDLSPRNKPFLNTKEAAVLKVSNLGTELSNWMSVGPDARRKLLETFDLSLEPPSLLRNRRPDHHIGWHMSVLEIYECLKYVHNLAPIKINRGIASGQPWKETAFKGGSDTGVLNLSSRVVDDHGNTHFVIATWNNNAIINEQELIEPYLGILNRLWEDFNGGL